MKITDRLEEIKGKLEDLKNLKITVGVQSKKGINRLGNSVSGSEKFAQPNTPNKIKVSKRYAKMSGAKMKVTSKKKTVKTYTDLAKIHEYGAPEAGIPERSFIRTIKNSKQSIGDRKTKLNQLSAGYLSGKISLEELTDEFGSFVVKQIVQDMGVDTAALKPESIKNRKQSLSNSPLVDTGALQNHVTYRRGDKN